MPIPLSDDFYRRLLESIDDYAVFTLDLDGHVVSWSAGAEKLLGYRPEEIRGRSADVIFTPEDVEREQPLSEMRGAREHGRSRDERWHVRKGGARFWATGAMFLLKDAAGAERGFVKVLRDSTDAHNAKLLEVEALQQLRLIIDAIPSLIAYVDREQRYVFHNRAYAEWMGGDIKGKTLREIVGAEQFERVRAHVERALAGERARFELEWDYPKAGRRWVRAEYVPHVGADGAVHGFVSLVHDVSDAKRTERELERRVERRTARLTAAHRELEAFAYTASHDLRAPLRKIDAYGALLEGAGLPPEQREHAGRIRAAVHGMHRIIDDMRDLARITQSSLELGEIDLTALAKRVAERVQAREPGRRVAWDIAPGLRLRGDVSLFEIALRHLFENAWKFTAGVPEAAVSLSLEHVDGRECFRLCDNGVGFDMAYADKLFRPFERLHAADKAGGTGVGLAIVQRVVERHGGRVWAHSAPGEGATFCFTVHERAAH